MKTIEVKKDQNEFFLDLKDFSDWYDISKIYFYSVTPIDGILMIKFFDKDEKLLKPIPLTPATSNPS